MHKHFFCRYPVVVFVFIGSLAVVLLLFPFHGYTDIYRWVDKEGVVHYTDTPPAQDAEEIHRYPELSSENPAAETDPRNAPRSPEIAAPAETATAPKSAESEAPPDSETMTRLKKNLERRTSSHQQRKFQRRIKAQQSKEGPAPDQDEPRP